MMKKFMTEIRRRPRLYSVLFVGLLVLLISVTLVVISLSPVSNGVKTSKVIEKRALNLVQQLVKDSRSISMRENAAQSQLWTCGNLFQASSEFDSAAAERSNLVARAQMVKFKRSTKANDAVIALVSFFDYASQADIRFASWGRGASQSCNQGRSGYRVRSGNPTQASSLRSLANAQKLKFISLWNDFAIDNGASLVGISDL